MHFPMISTLLVCPLTQCVVLRLGTNGIQSYPDHSLPPNTFRKGTKTEKGMPPLEAAKPDENMYGIRDANLPFGRLFHGTMEYFKRPEQTSTTYDNANQSTCGIPDAAYANSKVAIHPYFLKYAKLDRYCMQDVSVSFWKEDGSSDMLAKVTDICSTDPSDPAYCENPEDIKLWETKVRTMEKKGTLQPGTHYPEKTWCFFAKCWGDGTAQPGYKHPENNGNWFTTPDYPNNKDWALQHDTLEYHSKAAAYPKKGWDSYNGAYSLKFTQND